MNKLYEMLIDPANGKLSFTRVIVCITILFANAWVTIIVVSKGMIPELAGLSLFIGSVATVTYGYNKAAATIEAVANKTNGNGNLTATVTTAGAATTEVKQT